MFQARKIFNSLKSFPIHIPKRLKHTFEGRIKIKFLKLHSSNDGILAQQDQKFDNPKYFLLFLNGKSKKKSKSFPWRLMNTKESFTTTNTLVNLTETVPVANFIFSSIKHFCTCTISPLSLVNEQNSDYKNQKTNHDTNFLATELNKAFQTSAYNSYNYNFLKRCVAIYKNGNKTNHMSLLNKNTSLYGTYLWHNSYCFKSYSKNFEELKTKQTKKLLDTCYEETESKCIDKPLTRKQKLKSAVKDYGVTVIVFHVVLSLISLGVCYLIVISGFNYSKNVEAEENAATVETAAKFVVAYAIHKALAPARIAVTLTTAPFLVKKLRKIGILKSPKS